MPPAICPRTQREAARQEALATALREQLLDVNAERNNLQHELEADARQLREQLSAKAADVAKLQQQVLSAEEAERKAQGRLLEALAETAALQKEIGGRPGGQRATAAAAQRRERRGEPGHCADGPPLALEALGSGAKGGGLGSDRVFVAPGHRD